MLELNSSNSRNNDITANENVIDHEIWDANNDNTQDSNQYYQKYESLMKSKFKYKKSKIPGEPKKISIPMKPLTQFIPNSNYDYSADTEEQCEENNIVNRVSSIKMKDNNINQIDKNNLNIPAGEFNNSFYSSNNSFRVKNGYCVTEPDDNYHKYRNEFSSSFNNNNLQNQYFNNNPQYFQSISNNVTPQKINYFGNFPVIVNRGSMISTHYSSNNKNITNFENEKLENSIEYNLQHPEE
jgi:hypothetical protein